MSTTKPIQMGGAQNPAPQQTQQSQQGQTDGSSPQQQGGRVFRDWASI